MEAVKTIDAGYENYLEREEIPLTETIPHSIGWSAVLPTPSGIKT